MAARHCGAAPVRRLVVKLGTTLLIGPDGRLCTGLLDDVAAQAATLRARQVELLVVTSGAIGVGFPLLGYAERPGGLPKLQAAAAVGQCLLMEAYHRSFGAQGLVVGQILLTRDGLHERERFLNARNTLRALLQAGAVPVINENDTVSVDEIQFGDNDQLSAQVTTLAEADLLLVLTDVDGLRRRGADGRLQEDEAGLIRRVEHIDAAVTEHAGPGSRLGTGGMISKVAAARIVTASGAAMVIASGREPDVIVRVVRGESVGTRFEPRQDRLTGKKHWIAFSRRSSGLLWVDAGARRALIEEKKSLLPSGIVGVSGVFARGDAVRVACQGEPDFARGLTNYSHEQVERIKGRRTREIAGLLEGPCFEEVIHRDNLVVL